MKLKTVYRHLPVIVLILIVLATILLRMRLLPVPLERDEGEYAYIGQLMLDGIPPYSEAYNMKFPGIYFIYAGILWLFGETDIAIHFCLLLVNALTIILLFFFARKAFDNGVAVAAASAFALLSMSYHVQGFWANAEHFILPFILGANLLLFSALRKKNLLYVFWSALLFGCAALVKQQGAFFGIIGFGMMLVSLRQQTPFSGKEPWKFIFVYIGGILCPLLLCLLYLLHAGVIEKFYLWTFIYAKEYSLIPSLMDMKYSFIGGFQSLFYFASLIWIIAGVGFAAMLFSGTNNLSRFLTGGIFLAGVISLSVGFYFRPHYFILLLPAVALLYGIGIRFLFKIFSAAASPIVRYVPPMVAVIVSLLGTFAAHRDILLQFSIPQVTETVYHHNPFPYSKQISELIKERTSEKDRIAIFGNEPQWLFYAQRKSATSFIYIYSLVEEQPLAKQFRLEMMHQVESARPAMLLFTRVQADDDHKPPPWEELEKWFFAFANSHYTQTARFEYRNIHDTLLVTDPIQLAKKPTHLFWISIFEKKKE